MRVDRDKALAGALQLLNEVGLEKLTMRALGSALNVQAPSLYYYFPSKRALLDAMTDAIVAPVISQLEGTQLEKTQPADIAHAFRQAMLNYRDGALVVSGSYGATPNVLKFTDMLLGLFLQYGLPRKRAVDATFNLIYYVQGFVLEEQSFMQQWGTQEQTGARDLASNSFKKSLSTDYPNLRECMNSILEANFDARFAFGLETQMAGLQVLSHYRKRSE
jgi:TetR/AcrR family tetracycline transcriptional repressor